MGLGPGGASTSMIKLGGTMDLPKGDSDNPFTKPPGQGEELSEEEQDRVEVLEDAYWREFEAKGVDHLVLLKGGKG